LRLIGRRNPTNPAIALGFALLAVAAVVLLRNALPPAPHTVSLGDPATPASHFYPVEQAGDRAFRWSRATSAVTLPALATSQLVSITLDPSRPEGSPPTTFRLSIGDDEIATFEALPGRNTYTAHIGPGWRPDVRLVIDSDTFFPGPGDSRRLGLAVFEVGTSAQAGRTGLLLPPYLWLALAAVLPALAVLVLGPGSVRRAVAVGAAAAAVAVALCQVPGTVGLWVGAVGVGALILYEARRLSALDEGPYAWAARVLRSGWEVPAVALGTLGLALVWTWPLASRLGVSMPGWPADNFAFLYKLRLFRVALLERGTSPFFDPNSYAPFGFDLGLGEPTLANTVPGVLIGALAGGNDVVTYNVLVLLSFVVSGVGGYLLVRELSGSRQAAVLGAVAFAFAPYRMAQIAGHLQLVGTGWIALSFYFLERSLKTRSWRDGAMLGLCFALTALSAWYYAYMAGLALALYAAVRLWTERRALDRTAWMALLRPALAALLVLVPLGAPAALPSLRVYAEGGLTHSAKAADEHSASPLDYVIPNQLHPVWGEPFMRAHAEENIIETNLYAGLALAVIIFAGWWARRRARAAPERASFAWVVLAVVAGVLSLGLTLHGLQGTLQIQWPWGAGPLPMPGQLLYDWLPFYSSMRAYARWGLIVALGLVVLGGIAWAYLLRYGPGGFRTASRWFATLALVAIAVDLWTAPYAWGTSPVEPNEASRFVASLPDGTVMRMPLAASQSGPALWAQVYYDKPLAYGYETFEPEGWRARRPDLETFPDDRALDVLEEWGVRYVVVSGNAYGANWTGTLAYLKTLPRLRHLGDFVEPRAWEVDPSVLDAQPEHEPYALPDNLAVFELVR
jgi:hypothetical protein